MPEMRGMNEMEVLAGIPGIPRWSGMPGMPIIRGMAR